MRESSSLEAGAGRIQFAVRVRPGAARAVVGGRYGADAVVVAVTQRPVDGAANDAVITALARALGVPRSAVGIRAGQRGRSKVVAVSGDEAALRATLLALLDGPIPSR